MTKILEPLQQFYCDTCDDIIERPEHGWFDWIRDRSNAPVFSDRDWAIRHHINSGRSCLPARSPIGTKSYHLHHAMGFAQALVLHMFPSEREEFLTWARRMTVPYYEQARFYLRQAEEDEMFCPDNPRCYSPEILQRIIKEYADLKEDAA